MNSPASTHLTADKLATLRRFIGPQQMQTILHYMRGEEGRYYRLRLADLHEIIATMPRTYQTEGLGDRAMVSLHYFAGGSANWWITELDREPVQHQAFGMADLFGDGGELGYINLVELLAAGAELDLHFEPRTLSAMNPRRLAL